MLSTMRIELRAHDHPALGIPEAYKG